MLKPFPFRSAALACVAALAFVGCASQSPTASVSPPPLYPMKDFFRNSEQAYFRLSADGQTLGFMKPHNGRLNVHVQPISDAGTDKNVRRLSDETARDINNYAFKGAHHILYQKDFGGDENFHVVMIDIRSGTVKDLTPYPGVRASITDDLLDDPEHILVEHNLRNNEVFDVYKVNLATGKETLVAQNPGNFTGWVTDHAGRVRMGIAADGVNSVYFSRANDSEPFKEILKTDFREEIRPQFFDAKNEKIYATSNRGRDKAALVLMDPLTAKEESVLFTHPEVDVWSAGWSTYRKKLTFAQFQTDRTNEHFFDDTSRALYEKLKAKFPGDEVTIQSASRDESKMIVAYTNDRSPGVRYLYDAKTDALTQLAVLNPWIKPADMSELKYVQYTARDGLKIPAYLTLPKGRAAKNLPVIINPHGGPWVRDSWNYNPEVQFLANRGYAVLQPNYRGSTGYGRKYWEASFKQWGGTMQDDLTDGVNYLIAQGIADPKRVAIYGGSYGGYATLSGITKTPDLYAAAVSYVGVSNLFTFMKTIPPYWLPFQEVTYEQVGHPERDKAMFEERSPALNAHKIKTPLFVAQGAKDPRVNKAESDQMVDALRKRGVTVDYMVKDNEGHGFSNEENRFDFYEAMEKFFGKHLKPS
jgi:dipeptidyl aminopeptidase/acylaminoacyl peptidase